MKIIFFEVLTTILLVQVMSEESQKMSELEATCGNDCYKVVKPLLDQTNALQSQVDELENINKTNQEIEVLTRLFEVKFNTQYMKIEQNLEVLSKSTENTMEKHLEILDKKMDEKSKLVIGKTFQKLGSKYYYIEGTQKLNWFEAAHKCLSMGAHLASIKNWAEFNAIKPHLQLKKSYWIDINDLGTEGEFYSLTTGLPATYFNWHANNPSNFAQSEHCGDLWFNDNNHLMNDNKCDYKSYFICEHNM